MTSKQGVPRGSDGENATSSESPPTDHSSAASELDAEIDELVTHMQTPAAREARRKALRSRPSVRLDAKDPPHPEEGTPPQD